MSLMAITLPILPEKTAAWEAWMKELEGDRHEEFVRSRSRVGVRERTFRQHTPRGDVVIVTLEGEDPERAFQQMMSATDAFSTWFWAKAAEFHGMDLKAPREEHPSQLVIDTSARHESRSPPTTA